jgi:Spy/CpxP family protein refolding chaperone
MERAMGMRGEHGRWWNNPTVVEKLKLTEDQRKAMDGILQQHREKLIDLRASLEKAELAMEPMMREDQPNEAAAIAQIDKVAQARAELEKANARFLFALRAKLTPEQWKQVQEFRASHGEMNHQEMRHRFEQRWDRDGRKPGGDDRRMTPPAPAPPPGPQGMIEEVPGIDAPAGVPAEATN